MKNIRLLAAFAVLFYAGHASAQNAGSVSNHAFAIGKGAGQGGYTSLLCGAAQLAVGQSAADPICRTVTGDVTIDATGATSIGSSKVTPAMIASMTSAQLAAILSDETGTGANVFANSPVMVTPNLGTPSLLNLTNANGLPVGGISGLGTGVGAWLSAPSSANLLSAMTTKTGTGNLVFGTSPNITTPTGLVKGDVGLGSVDNTSDVTKWAATKTLTNTTYDTAGTGNSFSIAGVAALSNTGTGAIVRAASPTFTGTPAAPTAVNGTNTTQVATTAFVQSAVTASITGVSSIATNTGAFTLSQGITNVGNDIRLALNNATFQSATLSPAAAPGTSVAMMGLGATCKLTPVYSGRVEIRFDGSIGNSGAAASLTQTRYGTGTAPSNGAAATGATLGTENNAFSPIATAGVPFSNGGIITGLTVGTQYWFDQGTHSQAAGTATLYTPTCSIKEF